MFFQSSIREIAMRLCFLAPFVLVLAACASPPEETQVAAASPADPADVHMECHQESDAGSFLIHKVCTRTQSSADMARTQADLMHSLPNASLYHQAAGSLIKPTNQ
jgi:hypothetical protein